MSDTPSTTKPDYLRQARVACLWVVLAIVFGVLLIWYTLTKEDDSLAALRYIGCGVVAISALFNGWEAVKYFRLHQEQQANKK